MALSIKSDEADQLARELVAETGESLTTAVTEALRARLHEVRRSRRQLARRLLAISEEASRLPRADERSDEQIIGYDEHGLPG
jgi:antitoxin VapB